MQIDLREVADRGLYVGIKTSSDDLWLLSDLSVKTLPPKRTRVLEGGSFMVIDHHVKTSPSGAQSDVDGSFVDIVSGNDRKTFSGMKRFEISRQNGDGSDGEGVVITDSSLACNPTVDEPPVSWVNGKLMRRFHDIYALHLFRDGVREVLRAGR